MANSNSPKAQTAAATTETEPEPARVLIEVTAGIVPNDPMGEHRRLYAITSAEWESSTNPPALLAEANGKAMGYASYLMLQPDAVNWVRTDWIWL